MERYENYVKVEDFDKLFALGFEKRGDSYFYIVTTNPKTGEPYKSERKYYPELEVTANGSLVYHVGSKLIAKYFTEIIKEMKDTGVLQPAYNVLKGGYVW